MQISLRPLDQSEHDFLEDMLYEAIFVAEGTPKLPRSIILEPDIKKYIDEWASNRHDIAIVAVNGNELDGAIWGREFRNENRGYGYVDEETPEISMAVMEKFRNKGIGGR